MWQLLRDAGCIEHYSGERALQWLVGKKVAVDLSIVCWHHPLFLKFTYIITYPILLILCVISIVPLNWPPKDRRSQELHAHLVPKVWVYNIYYFTNSFIFWSLLPSKASPVCLCNTHTRERTHAHTRTRTNTRTHTRVHIPGSCRNIVFKSSWDADRRKRSQGCLWKARATMPARCFAYPMRRRMSTEREGPDAPG